MRKRLKTAWQGHSSRWFGDTRAWTCFMLIPSATLLPMKGSLHLSSTSPFSLPPAPSFLNYTFSHFHASIHSPISPPSASLFLSESTAAHGSILIEVSWVQILHSCFTIKTWTGGDRQKEDGEVERHHIGRENYCLCWSCLSTFYARLHSVMRFMRLLELKQNNAKKRAKRVQRRRKSEVRGEGWGWGG